MELDDYLHKDGTSLAASIEAAETSAEELVSLARQRYDEVNHSINAIVAPLWEYADDQISHGLPNGPLRGVPMSVKNLGQFMKGQITSAGARLLAENVADHDSTLVKRYKASGLVIFGKSNTPEFGLATTTEPVLHGPTTVSYTHLTLPTICSV